MKRKENTTKWNMFEPIAKGYDIFTNQGISIEPQFFISNSILLGEHFS